MSTGDKWSQNLKLVSIIVWNVNILAWSHNKQYEYCEEPVSFAIIPWSSESKGVSFESKFEEINWFTVLAFLNSVRVSCINFCVEVQRLSLHKAVLRSCRGLPLSRSTCI
jgi:hypothetical protein